MAPRATVVSHHGKGRLIGPVAAEHGWRWEEIDADTDSLGTFSGEVARTGSALATARRKATLGADRSAGWLLASEGTVSRTLWGLPVDHEVVVAVAPSRNVIVVGRSLSHDLRLRECEFTADLGERSLHDAAADLLAEGHHAMVRGADGGHPPLTGLASIEEVVVAARRALAQSGVARLATDLRAHLCPSRQPAITAAARDLFSRLAQSCPACHRPGFGPETPLRGRACRRCGSLTDEPLGERWECPWCRHHLDRLEDTGTVDPSRCTACNP